MATTKKDANLMVKISAEQKAALQALADAKGLGMSAYIRLLIAEAIEAAQK